MRPKLNDKKFYHVSELLLAICPRALGRRLVERPLPVVVAVVGVVAEQLRVAQPRVVLRRRLPVRVGPLRQLVEDLAQRAAVGRGPRGVAAS